MLSTYHERSPKESTESITKKAGRAAAARAQATSVLEAWGAERQAVDFGKIQNGGGVEFMHKRQLKKGADGQKKRLNSVYIYTF